MVEIAGLLLLCLAVLAAAMLIAWWIVWHLRRLRALPEETAHLAHQLLGELIDDGTLDVTERSATSWTLEGLLDGRPTYARLARDQRGSTTMRLELEVRMSDRDPAAGERRRRAASHLIEPLGGVVTVSGDRLHGTLAVPATSLGVSGVIRALARAAR